MNEQLTIEWSDVAGYLQAHIGVLRTVVVALLISWVVQKLVVWWIRHRSHGTKQQTSIIVNLVRLGVYLLGGVFILNEIGQPITPILTALGVGGLAVALGLQDTLANLFAGLNILASGQIHIGNVIELTSKKSGKVVDITWRHTVLSDTANDSTIIVPNAVLVKEVITNYGKEIPKKPSSDEKKKKVT